MTEAEQWSRFLGVPIGASSLEVCQAFERLASRLAPHELANLPFYAMPLSALPAEWKSTCNFCGGWYHDFCYHWLRKYLPEDYGRGAAVIIKDYRSDEESHKLAEQAQAVYMAMHGKEVPISKWLECLPKRDAIEVICGTIAHEFAHVIDAVCDPDSWLGIFDGETERPVVASALNKSFCGLVERAERQTSPPDPQLSCHGLRFTRIVAHLDFRLRQLGVTSHSIVAAGDRYGQVAYEECYDALGDEMFRYCGKPFQEILALPNSLAFERCALSGSGTNS